ncbi:carbohydrate ABC transporter permease [Teichococcus oryzae]|uniref:Carbohydrate ABC transporter permease n=1 Tax=Teichococcus oryzae TaxID=1608942 RepID=A0A5B2TJS9_9PROT|nr:carbohydrate ABC transporter permease [Pseudoroseomonas oryzae]KAA2214168.1 carbohydrate ABC transporter permease [Pseudoroseomonas oryzae]
MGTTTLPAPPAAAEARHGSLKRERRWAMIGAYIALAVFVVFFMTPPFHMLMTSLKSSAEIADLSGNPWIVGSPTLMNYWELLTEGNYLIHFRNSVIVTVCTVLISMVISTMAAFALARMKFWGSATLATGVFLTYLVPETLLFIPMFQIVGQLGLYNNLWAMVLIFPTLTVPFCTWIMIGYFASIPKELDEAALIDGAGHLQMLWKIFIPVALPGILAAMIFAFTVSWAAFIYPIAFLVSSDQMVLTVGIVSDLIRADTFQWGKIMAGALMAALPPLLVYAFLMDYYIAGLTAGATKG